MGTTAKPEGRAMQIHMHEVRKNNEKKSSPRVSKKRKKRDKDLQNSTRKAQKYNERLMQKTKGVESDPRVERNKSTSKTLKVLTQYNPQTLFEPL